VRQETELQIASLRAGLEAKEEEFNQFSTTEAMKETALAKGREEMARLRSTDEAAVKKNARTKSRKGEE
jgi:hypothetical protein